MRERIVSALFDEYFKFKCRGGYHPEVDEGRTSSLGVQERRKITFATVQIYLRETIWKKNF